ncbi:MAG TPA: hypothetical protein VMM56_06610 [Planctomycetaceae bacterium]|nr:hypothetical protein [Planctomycetaceae bacterium]
MLPNKLLSLVCLTVFTSQLTAQDDKLPPFKQIEDVTANPNVFEVSNQTKPLVLKSHAQAKKYFSAESLTKLLKEVDFDKQILLVFAWKGSGQDRLEVTVVESSPEQLVFVYKPGKTRDLRPHTYVYAVRSNVKWEEKQPPATATKKPGEFVKVSVNGKLKTGIFAIGGETTGSTITADGITWELDFGSNNTLLEQAQKWNGKQVLVKGRLHRKPGVEVRERWIVNVNSLVEAE